jgi:MerR family transcriptional regulator, redox-sensitive transcriptional activator SoxR
VADLTIGEVARRAGMRPSTLRFYEASGLLPPPRRRNGRRVYDVSIVDQLSVIAFGQSAGFTLPEIRTLFHGFGRDIPPSATWQALANAKLRELDDRILQLKQMRRALQNAVACGCLHLEDCAVAMRSEA